MTPKEAAATADSMPDLENVKQAAAAYIARGLQVVPLAKGKGCVEKDWLRLVFTPDDFKPGDNIGLRSVNGLVDIDCDAPEAVILAPEFLPPTEAVYGRPSKPNAHWLYHSHGFDKILAYKDLARDLDPKHATLVEIRVNHQSMAPPSIHPDDHEQLHWKAKFWVDPGDELPRDTLQRPVQLLATATLLARYYNPPSNRNDWTMAVAGYLRKHGLTEQEVTKLYTSVWKKQLVFEPHQEHRLSEIRRTFSHGDDHTLTGATELKQFMAKGKEFVKSLDVIWPSGGEHVDAAGWLRKGRQIIASSERNARLALQKLGVELSHDAFARHSHVRYKGHTTFLDNAIRNQLWVDIERAFGFRPNADIYDVLLDVEARAHTHHPVVDYLNGLTWDGEPRLDRWLITYGQAPDTEFVRAVGSIVLIAAVRRVRQPGCKFDEMLVLVSSVQGTDKSTAIESLCPCRDWFADDLPLNVSAKEVIERTGGRWIIEAAELSGLRRTQTEHLKAMLSRRVDGPVRLAYEKKPVNEPRQFVVIGTTNSGGFLKDTTGNRRFWPVSVGRFDTASLARDRDQLWAEAAAREKAGADIRLPEKLWTAAANEQDKRLELHPWYDTLAVEFEGTAPMKVDPENIWQLVGVQSDRRTAQLGRDIRELMERFDFQRQTIRVSRVPKPIKGWQRGAGEVTEWQPPWAAVTG